MKHNKKKIAFFILLAAVIISLILYLVVLPIYVSSYYQNNVHAATRSLDKSFEEVSKTTERLLITNPSSIEVRKRNDATDIRELVKTTKEKIDKGK